MTASRPPPHLAPGARLRAFLANIHHETGGLTVIEEAPSRRSVYCDGSKPYGCPAGRDAYFGRGPIQLSWNCELQGPLRTRWASICSTTRSS